MTKPAKPDPQPGPGPEPAAKPAPTPALDWPAMMRAGLSPLHQGGLALRPPEFWALTPSELALMLGQTATPAMGRARFEALAALYPDTAPGGA